jgi:hypothetical protein
MSALDRVRPASFVDPEGTEHFFNVNSLERSTGKKGSTQEILDSDESISQDQGIKAWKFPVDAYFTGQDYDIPTDAFVTALSLGYSQDNPGTLKHPRWGNINVFPIDISQKEELVNGVLIGRVTVTFVEVFPKVYPTTDLSTLSDGLKNLDEMEEQSEEISEGMDQSTAQAQNNTNEKLSKATGTISKAINDGSDKFNTIQKSINDQIDVLGDVVDIIAGIQRLIRTPARVKDQTLNKVNGYLDMIETLCDGFNDKNETIPTNQKNNVTMMELVGGMGVGALAEAAAYTDFTIRSEAIAAIEKIDEGFSIFDTAFNEARTTGNVQDEYSGDHNFWSLLINALRNIKQLLLESAFSLKAEKKITLTNNSDIISLCYQYYGKVDDDTIEFFILTNRIINDEYIEIPIGREVVVYV